MASQGPGIREQNRAKVNADLLRAGRVELARVGAASLSVRAVAREMGMAPSALFRYISGRDELLTLLIVDACNGLADEAEPREAAAARTDFRGRWQALAHGMRDWALSHPNEWALLYGSPVPDYDAPGQTTNEAGTRLTNLLMRIGADAAAAGIGPAALGDDAAAEAERAVADIVAGSGMPAVFLTHGVLVWTSLIGAISAEVFSQLGPGVGDPDALFAYAVRLGERTLFGA